MTSHFVTQIKHFLPKLATFQYDFDRMRVTFRNLIDKVAPLIKAGIPSLDELKTYLRRCFQELAPQLSTAKSFNDVIDIVQDACTIINICCLEAIVDRYEITEAEKSLLQNSRKKLILFVRM